MAWTATLQSVAPQPGNPANVEATVLFVNGAESFTVKTHADNLTVQGLKRWAKRQVDAFEARQTAQAALAPIVGQTVELEATPGEDAALTTFKQRWVTLMKLKRLGSAVPAIVTMTNNLQSQVDAALQANQSWINEVN
jgi:hypothetical protein